MKEGEVILTVPLKAMLTTRRIPLSFKRKFPKDIAVHALLAAFLTLGDKEDLQKYELWRQVWPTRQDFEDSMPLLWPQSLRGPNPCSDEGAGQMNLLPPSVSGAWNTLRKRKNEHEYETSHQDLLAQQEQRLHKAWSSVVSVFPDVDWEIYSYNWLIVNTRSFYFLMPGQKPPEDRNDAMALLPFADYFNHSDVEVCLVFPARFKHNSRTFGCLSPVLTIGTFAHFAGRRQVRRPKICLQGDQALWY
jgi:hypothetical protein